MASSIAPVLKYPGSKWRLADWIISYFPPNYEKMTYLEPYFGSGAVFFNKHRSSIETINDVDNNVMNLFKTIRDCPEELARLIRFTPWSRNEYKQSYQTTGEQIEDARRFLIRMWMAIGAKSSDKTGWRNNIKSINGNLNKWNYGLPEEILKCANRLLTNGKNIVQIDTSPAVDLIERHKKKNVFIYADPPYPLSTRSKRIYAYEMNDQGHVILLDVLDNHPGPVIISGYACDLYDTRLQHWQRVTKITTAELGRKRKEVLWINPVASEMLNYSLF